MENRIWELFHIPHDGHRFPAELMRGLTVSEGEFLRYHLTMCDKDISLAVPEEYCAGSHVVRFGISRLLCDVERFPGEEEVMNRYGMGVCYEKAYDGRQLREVTGEVRQETFRYYNEHHRRMDALCEKHPRLLLIDLHSYSEEIVPKAWNETGRDMPDLCIGTDPEFTPPALAEIVRKAALEGGLTAEENYPYEGTFVPCAVLARDTECDCISIMLEFRRDTYLRPDGSPDPSGVLRLRGLIRRILREAVLI